MRLVSLLILICLSVSLVGQIVDDSTKQIYGVETTEFTTWSNLLDNVEDYQQVDSSIYLFERQSFVQRSGRKYQDLGNFGTASSPVFYDPPQLFGRTSGFDAYSFFAYDPAQIKLYDTKSPFTEIFVYLGGSNRNIVNFDFSRNIKKNWNFGFDIRKITTNKQLAPAHQTDRQVVGTSFISYMHYRHPKVPYQVAINYSTMNHEVDELGGVRKKSNHVRNDFFRFDNALVHLEEAQGIAKILRWNLYQDYQIEKQFQMYHVFDYRKETNTYKDEAGGESADGYNSYTDFYDDFFINSMSTDERAVFTSVSNEVGIKGNASSVFYRAYARLRAIDWKYLLYDPGEKTVEKYLGAYARFHWKEKFDISAHAEYLVGGEYQFGGTLSGDFVDIKYRSMRYNVPFIYSDYFGNHHEWHNSFDPVFVNKLEGTIKINLGFIELKPKVSFTAYNNFLYFDTDIQPRQSLGGLVSSVGGNVNFRLYNRKKEGWHIENELLVTGVSGEFSDFVRVPELFYNGRYFWRGNWFKDLIPVELGVDAHARSAYFANAYAPEIQQFYLQNDQEIFGYIATDLFINMKIDHFFFMVKWTYFNQRRNDGYLVTPNYPGQQKVIDLSIKWMFFD